MHHFIGVLEANRFGGEMEGIPIHVEEPGNQIQTTGLQTTMVVLQGKLLPETWAAPKLLGKSWIDLF